MNDGCPEQNLSLELNRRFPLEADGLEREQLSGVSDDIVGRVVAVHVLRGGVGSRPVTVNPPDSDG